MTCIVIGSVTDTTFEARPLQSISRRLTRYKGISIVYDVFYPVSAMADYTSVSDAFAGVTGTLSAAVNNGQFEANMRTLCVQYGATDLLHASVPPNSMTASLHTPPSARSPKAKSPQGIPGIVLGVLAALGVGAYFIRQRYLKVHDVADAEQHETPYPIQEQGRFGQMTHVAL